MTYSFTFLSLRTLPGKSMKDCTIGYCFKKNLYNGIEIVFAAHNP